jgi:hypothetical protein
MKIFHFIHVPIIFIIKYILINIANYITSIVLDWSQDNSRGYTWLKIHCLKTPSSKEHVNLRVQCHTGARLHAGITVHVSHYCPNYTTHLTETVMLKARLYKGELASPSRYTSLSITLLLT